MAQSGPCSSKELASLFPSSSLIQEKALDGRGREEASFPSVNFLAADRMLMTIHHSEGNSDVVRANS